MVAVGAPDSVVYAAEQVAPCRRRPAGVGAISPVLPCPLGSHTVLIAGRAERGAAWMSVPGGHVGYGRWGKCHSSGVRWSTTHCGLAPLIAQDQQQAVGLPDAGL